MVPTSWGGFERSMGVTTSYHGAWRTRMLDNCWFLYQLIRPLPSPLPGLNFSLWKVRELCWLPSKFPPALVGEASTSRMRCRGDTLTHLDSLETLASSLERSLCLLGRELSYSQSCFPLVSLCDMNPALPHLVQSQTNK